MDGASGQKLGNGLALGQLDPNPAQKFLANGLGGPGGQDRPAQLAAGIGQGGLDRMQAIQPVLAPRLDGPWIAAGRAVTFFRPFHIGLGVEMTPVFLTAFMGGLGSHAGLIKEYGRG